MFPNSSTLIFKSWMMAHINRMAAALTPEHEAQSFGNTNQIFCCGCG
jgi:hypothetical protein